MKIYLSFLLVTGVIFLVMGLKLLFKKGYVENKFPYEGSRLYSEKDAYNYHKYGIGVTSLIMGLISLGYVAFVLFAN